MSQDPVPLYLGAGRTVCRVVTWEAVGRRRERLPPESSGGLPRYVLGLQGAAQGLEFNYPTGMRRGLLLNAGKHLGYKCQV